MKEKKKRLQLFDINKDGKGISKSRMAKRGTLKHFFISYKDNFGKLTLLNMMMVLGNFPLIFLIITLSGLTKNEASIPSFDVFQNLAGYFANTEASAHSMALFAQEGLQGITYKPTTLTYVFYGISALTLFTFGIVNVGTAYIFRNIAKGEPVFIWSDFIYAIKRNWKQAFPFGMIDLGINAILLWNMYSMYLSSNGNFFTSTMFWCNVVLFALYFVMRFYVYIQMVTFKLTVFKIIKNSLIFALLGFKRNILAFLGAVACILIEIVFLVGAGGILLPFAISVPFLILFSTLAYMKVYAAYFKMKEVMIDPYLKEHPEEMPEAAGDDDVIMEDDVTRNEKLDKIKKNI